MTRWEISKLLWLVWRACMWGSYEDRRDIAIALASGAEEIKLRTVAMLAELEREMAAKIRVSPKGKAGKGPANVE